MSNISVNRKDETKVLKEERRDGIRRSVIFDTGPTAILQYGILRIRSSFPGTSQLATIYCWMEAVRDFNWLTQLMKMLICGLNPRWGQSMQGLPVGRPALICQLHELKQGGVLTAIDRLEAELDRWGRICLQDLTVREDHGLSMMAKMEVRETCPYH